MSIKITDTQHYQDIADAIRAKTGSEVAMTPGQMAAEIAAIPEGGDTLEDVLTGSIEEYVTTKRTVTTVKPHLFRNSTKLTKFSADYATSVGDYAFNNVCRGTARKVEINLPRLLTAGINSFGNDLNAVPTGMELTLDAPLLQTAQGSSFYGSALVEAIFPALSSVGDNCFYGSRHLTKLKIDSLVYSSRNAFGSCAALTEVYAPLLQTVDTSAFTGDMALEKIELPAATSIGTSAFNSCTSLTTLILSGSTVCALQNANAFYNSAITAGTGFIYVPDSLVDTYQSATNWSTHAAQIKGISELPA